MDSGSSLKAIKQLIGQTPLIINPDRDADSFQSALAAVPTEKLQSYYRTLTDEDRRRVHDGVIGVFRWVLLVRRTNRMHVELQCC